MSQQTTSTSPRPPRFNWLSRIDTIRVSTDTLRKWVEKNRTLNTYIVLRISPQDVTEANTVDAKPHDPTDGMYYRGSDHPVHIDPETFLQTTPLPETLTEHDLKDSIDVFGNGQYTYTTAVDYH